MQVGGLFLLTLIVYILIIRISATARYSDEDEDPYLTLQFKRFIFGDKTTTTTRSPGFWTPRTTYSPSGACASRPCEHGGICTPRGQTTYECKCVGPWRGIYCGIADACYNSPCQNGGTCLNVNDDYWCKCTNDYYGQTCQTKFYNPGGSDNYCRPNICNTGRCVSLKTTYYCQCPDDRYGEHCEKRFLKRNVSKRQSFYKLLNQIKRVLNEQNDNGENNNND